MCGIKIWTDLSTVLSQFTRVTDRRTDGQTDRRTDRILIARPRLHSMQRGKKVAIRSVLPVEVAFHASLTPLWSRDRLWGCTHRH